MKPYAIPSVRKLHELLELPKPKHPLISVIDFSEIKCFDNPILESVTYGFYCITLKKNFKGNMRYGQQPYDFDDGTMTFFAPNQVVHTEIRDDWELEGLWLVFHPDFIQGFSLGKDISQYNYFSYAVYEALHVSTEEENTVTVLLNDIIKQTEMPMDAFSQPIIVKQIELLLSYCDRFYHRQFLTRKQASNNLLLSFEQALDECFQKMEKDGHTIPSVILLAKKLNLSANYLSDMLRNLTGQSAQQHIQQKLLYKAKELLSTTELSVSEIAYRLGFGYPQSFSKLFKSKTNITPKQYRAMLN
jgi:AraC family transcriptional activator of pobA